MTNRAAFVLFCLLSACGDDGLVVIAAPPKACASDAECAGGEKCIEGGCRPLDLFTCDAPGGERQALIEATPNRIDFGAVPVNQDKTVQVTVRNVGTCMLNLSEVSIDRASSKDFFCEGCALDGGYPMVLLPFDERTVLVHYKPRDASLDEGKLNIVSDDRAYPLVQVPLKTSYTGEPKLQVTPAVLSFGYVEPGDTTDETIRITNAGTGNAVLTITDLEIKLDSAVAYDKVAPRLPFYLSPGASIAVKVRYRPPASPPGDHNARLVITTDDEQQTEVTLRGSSRTPPSMVLSSELVDFGSVPVGTMATRIISLRNQAKDPMDTPPTSDLVAKGVMQKASSTDFSFSPTMLSAIPPGGAIDVLFRFQPTVSGPHTGTYTLYTNDPSIPEIDIVVRGLATVSAGAKTVKVEMNYENGGDSWADNDLRQVQMFMEDPVGDWVGKKRPSPDWTPYGHPTWFAFGQKDEPQRVILTDANGDGDFPVYVNYLEDCASVPSQMVAFVLGISLSALTNYLTEGIIQINGMDLAQVIANLCIDHSGSNVAVRVYLDGTLKLEKTVHVSRKGDVTPAVTLTRSSGVFNISPTP